MGSKADVAFFELGDAFAEADCVELSAVTRQGLDEFLGRLGTLVDEARGRRARARAVRACSGPGGGLLACVRDDDGAWRVTGRAAERVVALADLTNPEAIAYVQRPVAARWASSGRSHAPARAKATSCASVAVELEYVEGICERMLAVVKVGTSSITDATRRARRRRAR